MRHFGHSTQWRRRGAMAHARYDRFCSEPSPESDLPTITNFSVAEWTLADMVPTVLDVCGHGYSSP